MKFKGHYLAMMGLRWALLSCLIGMIVSCRLHAQDFVKHDWKELKFDLPFVAELSDSLFVVASARSDVGRNGKPQIVISLQWIEIGGVVLRILDIPMSDRAWPTALVVDRESGVMSLGIQSWSFTTGATFHLMRIPNDGPPTRIYSSAADASAFVDVPGSGHFLFTETQANQDTRLVCANHDGTVVWARLLNGFDGSLKNQNNVVLLDSSKFGLLLETRHPANAQPTEYEWLVYDMTGTLLSRMAIHPNGWIVSAVWFHGDLVYVVRRREGESLQSRFVLASTAGKEALLFEMLGGIWTVDFLRFNGSMELGVAYAHGEMGLAWIDKDLRLTKTTMIVDHAERNAIAGRSLASQNLVVLGVQKEGRKPICELYRFR